MSKPPYRSLRIGLRIVSVLIAVGGLLMIFADKPLIVRGQKSLSRTTFEKTLLAQSGRPPSSLRDFVS